MSNETDLAWLARNVHFWDESAYAAMCGGVERVMWVSGSAYGQMSEFKNAVTKDQWLARRAELQNKPSWSEFRKSATYMAQDSDGAWRAFECEPTPSSHIWNARHGWRGYANIDDLKSPKCEVLGDWRDTLERRPEYTRAETEVELVKAVFEPFISIEDNQEQDMSQQQEMNQDNGWFERGELPPAGIECEAYVDGRWQECYVVGFSRIGDPVIEVNRSITDVNRCKFRPIRTEREVAIEHMQSDIAERWANCEELAKHLIDKGWVKEQK